jgi:hypothetical protein
VSDSPNLQAIRTLLHAVRRRRRLASALDGLARVALPWGLVIAAVSVTGQRVFGTDPVPFDRLAWLAVTPVLGVLAWAYLRPISLRACARAVDRHYDLHDRIGTAWEFSQANTSLGSTDPRAVELASVAIADGLSLVPGKKVAPVVTLRVPPPRRIDVLAAVLLGVSLLIPAVPAQKPTVPLRPADAETPEAMRSPTGADMTMAEPLMDELRALRQRQDAASQAADAVLDVLDALERGELDRAEALKRLEEIDQALAEAELDMDASVDEDPGILAEGMRELAEALRQHEITEEAADALSKSDGDEAEKALQKAFERANEDTGARDAMEAAMKDAEKALGRSASDKTDTSQKLADAERRLKRQQKRPAEDAKEQERRLKKQKEALERIKRQHEREKAAQRELEKLRRQSKGARSGAGGSKAQQKKQQQQMSKGVGSAAQKASAARRMDAARDGVEEARTFIRKSGKKGEAQDRRKKQQQGFGKRAKGEKGKKGDSKGPKMLVEGEVGEGTPDAVMMGEGQGEGEGEGEGEGQGEGEGEGEGQGQGEGQSDGAGQGLGDGMGQGVGGALGDPTGINAKKRNLNVDAKQGRGATRAEVIEQASQDGFANTSYQRVYRDYRSFAQSAIDSETVPPGQRRRVRRYYKLIQPRD